MAMSAKRIPRLDNGAFPQQNPPPPPPS